MPLTVPTYAQCRYRNRKQQLITNVLGVCDRHMRFVYVLPIWEGSASDSRVLRSALTRSCPIYLLVNTTWLMLDTQTVQDYLVEADQPNHLNEWATYGSRPNNYKELFNLRYSSARNVVERTFGLLKKRWLYYDQPHFLM